MKRHLENIRRIAKGDGVLTACGALLLLIFGIIAWLSAGLEKYGNLETDRLLTFIGLYMGAGAVFIVAVNRVVKGAARIHLAVLMGVGVVMRLTMFPSTPIIENDYYRYLWDGALSAHGQNPYVHAPSAYMSATSPNLSFEVTPEGRRTLTKINFPEVRTIYPPVAQGAFALAYMLYPFDVVGLRMVYLLFDLITLVLLWRLLGALKRQSMWLLVYWWNPLVVKELFNSVHMDGLIFPFMLGALLLLIQKRSLFATVCVVCAAGVKLWPILGLVFVMAHILRTPSSQRMHTSWSRMGTLVASLGIALGILALLALPVFISRPDDTSGFVTYTLHWRNNDGVFRLVFHGLKWVLHLSGQSDRAYRYARYATGVLYVGLLLLILRQWKNDAGHTVMAFLLAIGGLFILSPTQFPWYATWLIPLLALHHWFPFHLYTLLLPLYYLQHWCAKTGHLPWFEGAVVWLEHVPVWVALVLWHRYQVDAPSRILIFRKLLNATRT
ncbi:MAG: DUF2029 domain-containing protein [Deltaproteobacteria bacterium]|nr:DUF2029 domain-containing protein [Deltaproteobacteria bacterium]